MPSIEEEIGKLILYLRSYIKTNIKERAIGLISAKRSGLIEVIKSILCGIVT